MSAGHEHRHLLDGAAGVAALSRDGFDEKAIKILSRAHAHNKAQHPTHAQRRSLPKKTRSKKWCIIAVVRWAMWSTWHEPVAFFLMRRLNGSNNVFSADFSTAEPFRCV